MRRRWDFTDLRPNLEDFELLERDVEIKPESDGLKISSSRFLEPRPDPPSVIYAPPPCEQILPDGRIRAYIPIIIEDPRILSTSSSSSISIVKPPNQTKFLLMVKEEIPISSTLTSLEMTASSSQIFKPGAEFPREFRNRLRNIHSDYRLCSGGPIAYDPNTGLEFGFLMTNQAVYAVYGRKAWLSEAPSRDTSFVSARFAAAVKVQEKSDEPFFKFRMVYDKNRNTMSYYIDDISVLIIRNLGHRLHEKYSTLDYGGESETLKPEFFKFGFGHFTFLDHQLPDNYARDMIYIDRDSDHLNIIYRSESGLCILHDDGVYREIYPDVRGVHGRIIPKYTFAVTHSASRFQYFDQGVISKIESITINSPRDGRRCGRHGEPLKLYDV